MFEVDASGILNVSARDKMSEREQQMRITPTSGLSPDEIDRLIAEATLSVDADRRVKEVIGLRAKLESLTRNTQRSFREFGGALTQREREDGQLALIEGDKGVQSEDPEEIRRALKSIEKLAVLLTSAMMNSPSNAAGPDANDPNERL